MSDIPRLRNEVERLRAELKTAEAALFEAQKSASPVQLDDIFRRTVTRGHGSKRKNVEERGRVVGFSKGYNNELRPRIRMIKKDGSDGTRIREMYKFEKWEAVKIN